jgi:hypothetical protein
MRPLGRRFIDPFGHMWLVGDGSPLVPPAVGRRAAAAH